MGEYGWLVTWALIGGGALVVLIAVMSLFCVVEQGTVGIVTEFGKYSRVVGPGLNFILPIESVRSLTLQNMSKTMDFEAITEDQAKVGFSANLVYAVLDNREETLKSVAYRFVDNESFERSLNAAVESSIRSLVATKKQAEIIGIRGELVGTVKAHLDQALEGWGYNLLDLQINDIKFDAQVMNSMAQVVSAKNSLNAAEFEGQALLVRKTKEAEAHGRAIVISAEAEAKAEQERGKGLAWFREEVAKGMVESAEMLDKKHVGQDVMLFAMWTETLKDMVETGKGNTFFFDGSTDAMQRTMRQLMSVATKGTKTEVPNEN